MPALLNADDYRRGARRVLPRGLFEYIDRGTEDELALQRLREARHRVCATHPDGPGHARDDNGGPMERSSQNDSRCPGARGREVSWRVW